MLRKRSRSLQKDQQQQQQHMMGHPTTNSDAALGRNIKLGNSIFNVPYLFVGGHGPNKGLQFDSDSVRSPTSPLDTRLLSNHPVRSPTRSSLLHHHEGNPNQRSWDCCKVGLSIVESLEDCCSGFSGKKISLSPQMMIKTPNCPTCMVDSSFESSKSLPKDFCKAQNGAVIHNKGECESNSNVLFEIGETGLGLEHEEEPFGRTRSCSLDSCSPLKTNFGGMLTSSKSDSDSDSFAMKDHMRFQVSSPPHFIGGSQSQNSKTFPPTESESNTVVSLCSSNNEFFKSLSASEIELSEDYTCVISHGPNPKKTHIFGDCILEPHSDVFVKNLFKNEEKENEKGVILIGNNRLQTPTRYPSSDFLSFCHHCNKKLEEGKDIYIYGGEKAFCSLTCRAMEIMIDEELEKSNSPCEESPKLPFGEQIFETGIPPAT